MFTREEGPTALRADLLSGLSFSSRPEHIQVDGHSGSAVAGVSSVWNGSRGFVAVLIRFIDPPHVERYMYSESLTDVSMLALALAEALRFAGAMGFRMDDPGFQELDEAARAKRLLNWNLIRKVRVPKAPETPLAAVENDAPEAVSAASAVGASNDEVAIVLESVDVYPDGDSTERFGSPIQTESSVLELVEESVPLPEVAEPTEGVTFEDLFVEPAPTTIAPSAPPIEPKPPCSAAEELLVESEEGAVESESLAIEPVEAVVETSQPAEAAGQGEILESVLIEEVAPENDDTPVSFGYMNVVVPATEEMREFSDKETIEAKIEGDGGFATERPMAPGTVLGKVELIRLGDRSQLSSLSRLLSFF